VSLKTYGYVRMDGDEETRKIAALAIAHRDLITANPTETISGDVRQYELKSDCEIQREIGQRMNILVESLGVKMQLFDMVASFIPAKLLLATPGVGGQQVHYDSEMEAYSVLLHCVDSVSAGLPIVPSEMTADPSTPAAYSATSRKDLLFHSVPLKSGDLIFFKHQVPHFGPKNTDPLNDRLVLFKLLVKRRDVHNMDIDKYSNPVWQISERIYGDESPEYIFQLIKAADDNPLHRYDWSRSERAAYVRRLSHAIGVMMDTLVE